jgi:hypothetical protein
MSEYIESIVKLIDYLSPSPFSKDDIEWEHEYDEIFSELIFNLATLTSIIHKSGQYQVTRYLQLGYKDKEIVLFVKVPSWKLYHRIKSKAALDQLAFLISHYLKLNVVPVTIALEGYESIVKKYVPEKIYKRCMMMEDYGFKGTIAQKVIKTKDSEPNCDLTNVDLENIHRCLMFNIITGRKDARIDNSIVDLDNNLFEIDNEDIGFNTTDSWLLHKFKDDIINEKLVDHMLTFNVSIIDDVFDKMSQFTISNNIKKIIKDNFLRVLTILRTNNNVTFKDLIKN